MPLSPGELPQPSWESSGGRNADLARLFDAAWRRRLCRSCAMVLRRPMQGLGAFMSGIRPVLAGTPFSVNASGLRIGWEPVALVAVLAELGESGLPDPRSSSFSSPWVRKAGG